MSILANLKIGQRVALLGAAALIGIGTVSAIFVTQRFIEADYRRISDSISDQQRKMVEAGNILSGSRQWEQNFLLSKNLADVEQYKKTVSAATAILKDLEKSAPADIGSSVSAVDGAVARYQAAFLALVDKKQELGLDPDSGFEGTMRSAVHTVEERVGEGDNPQLEISMLLLRRHEKDFILRGDEKYIKKHNDEAANFKTALKAAFKPGAKRMKIDDAFEVYRSAFDLYSKASLDDKRLQGVSSQEYQALAPVLEGATSKYGAMAQALDVFRAAAIANKQLEADAVEARARSEQDRIAAQERAEADAAERLRIATSGLAAGLKRLASGDLAFQLDDAFAPDFEALRHDFNASVRQLGETLTAVSASIGSMEDGTREIASAAQDLSQRTERQAASLEETAAALDEITANVKSSTQMTGEARKVAARANEAAGKSAAVVGHAEDAMRRIEDSSQQISNIIGVIDEIAFRPIFWRSMQALRLRVRARPARALPSSRRKCASWRSAQRRPPRKSRA